MLSTELERETPESPPLKTFGSWVMLQPHFDDFAYSASIAVRKLVKNRLDGGMQTQVFLATVYSKVNGNKLVPQAREFVKSSGFSDQGAQALYERRREEDNEACRRAGIIQLEPMGFVESDFRRVPSLRDKPIIKNACDLTASFLRKLRYHSPVDWYPAFHINAQDQDDFQKILQKWENVKELNCPNLIGTMGPVGIERYDHLFIREVIKDNPWLTLWADQPYFSSYKQKPDGDFVRRRRLIRVPVFATAEDYEWKKYVISAYNSQIRFNYPNLENWSLEKLATKLAEFIYLKPEDIINPKHPFAFLVSAQLKDSVMAKYQ